MTRDSIRGHLELLVLAVIADRPMHGYGVVEALLARSEGAFDLPEGSVYPALYRLEEAGLLESDWSVIEGRRRRVYRITDRGHATLVEKRREWVSFTDAIGAVIGRHPWPATN